MNRRHQQQRLGLVVSALVQRLEAAERRCAALEKRDVERERELERLRGSLHLLWRGFEAARAAPTRPPAPVPSMPRLERRVPASEAAEVLGCDARTVRRLVESGRLRGAALDLGTGRKRWTVEAADLERLISGSPAAPDPETRAVAGRSAP